MIHKLKTVNFIKCFIYFCTTESTYRHQANIDDEVVTMEILDTAGQVRQTVQIRTLTQFEVFFTTLQLLVNVTQTEEDDGATVSEE